MAHSPEKQVAISIIDRLIASMREPMIPEDLQEEIAKFKRESRVELEDACASDLSFSLPP